MTFAPAASADQVSKRLWSEVSSIRLGAENATAKAASLRSIFDRSLARRIDNVRSQTDDDIRDLFRMVKTASFFAQSGDYRSRNTYLAAMRCVLRELERRGLSATFERQSVYESLIMARDFAAASALIEAHPAGDFWDYSQFKPPSSIIGHQPSGYVERDGVLTWIPVTLSAEGAYLVVVIGCHFAKDAAIAIRADAELTAALAHINVVWLISGAELDRDVLTEWNRQFPEFPGMIAFDNADWKGVDFTATPSFTVFRNGVKLDPVDDLDPRRGTGAIRRALGVRPESAP